ncbi:ligase-associated DNA damage response endonuclease PdeM [Donghicola sp. B5-SW-15]|uniref:Ligase-associated DNA damage response endonuclease PdeM n=2 Tax=Donghicola mangrovi TaxID=2729614 RepID=A0A850Q5M9_9RHOB|nr:ligase-associated DNA damage response endonuclease PdeM [Donghicola mangrovi]NVO24254.1 ligase-associated DNA damage response endonuclease PdeM [Donghicola mangrovi]
MSILTFAFCGTELEALPSGALFWPAHDLLCVSDLHLGKSERIARRGGTLLPPYETAATLTRLEQAIDLTRPKTVVCLGDSFDDLAAGEALPNRDRDWLFRLQAGREWIWIEGNHDPAPLDLAGTHMAELRLGPLTFRHIAEQGAQGEISGHYHPKAAITLRGRHISRPCFLRSADRVILPAFGAYTGGLKCSDPVLKGLMDASAVALLTGPQITPLPYGKVR